MKKLHSTASQFLRFATVGGVATAIHYLILVVLVHATNMDAVWASSIGFIVSAVCNYLLNYRFTFKSNVEHRGAIFKFFLVAGVGLLLNSLVMQVSTEYAGMHYLLAQLLATALVLIWNFTGNRLWTFKLA
jgi:putative flippase GtrA